MSSAKPRLELRLLPLTSIQEDPNQPRKHFDEASLEQFATDVEAVADGDAKPWITGLLHPIVVYPEPGDSPSDNPSTYRILAGARRFRAYQLRCWPEIPARVIPSPRSAAQIIMSQLTENRSREDTTLFEDAAAVRDAWDTWRMQHPNGTQAEFAHEFRKSRAWISRHLAVTRSTGLSRTAAVEGHITEAEAVRLFGKLTYEVQRELLRQARSTGTTITVATVRALLPTRSAKGTKPSVEPPGPAEPQARSTVIAFRFRPSQVRMLLQALGAPAPPDDRELEGALIRAVSDPHGLSPGDPPRIALRLPISDVRRLLDSLGVPPPTDDHALVTTLAETLEARIAQV